MKKQDFKVIWGQILLILVWKWVHRVEINTFCVRGDWLVRGAKAIK